LGILYSRGYPAILTAPSSMPDRPDRRREKDHPVPYAAPPADIMPVIDAPPTPLISLAPGGQYVALVHHETHPPIAMLARPYLPLAGIRVDPRLAARRRLRRAGGLSVLQVSDGTERFLSLPDDAQVGAPVWAPDGRRFAITVDRADGVGLWAGDAKTGEVAEIAGLTVCDVLGGDSGGGGTFRWSRDGSSLLVLAVPERRQSLGAPVTEPHVEETTGKLSQLATYQDLLRTQADEDSFEVLATSVPCRIDPVSGERTEVGPRGLYYGLTDSPDGSHLLVQYLQRPFSFRVPWFWFARRAEVWTAAGDVRAVLADLPVSDEVPRQGVPTGPRMIGWEERLPATVAWVEALDGGDPVAPAEFRDRIFQLAAPFGGAPERAFDVRHRCLGWYDLDAPHQVLMLEHDRDRRWLTTWLVDLSAPGESRVIFDRSADDAYGDPGAPLPTVHPDGTQTALGHGSAIYLRGEGATPDGNRPFLDLFDLATGTSTRLHESPPGSVEHVVGVTPAGPGLGGVVGPGLAEGGVAGPGLAEGGVAGPELAEGEVVLLHESPAEPPNLVVAALDGSGSRPLTAWPDPHPQLTQVTKRLIAHDRGDGVTLSGMLYLPPGHDPAMDGRLPLVIWAYPFDYGNSDTAGQIRAGSFEFTRITALGPVVFTLRGYAVLNDATMPVIGDPETMNDTYLEQVTGAARAHIRALDEAGVIDPTRVAVGGHSYGAFMTANLLAHTKEFVAGIARSGAYNRTLTPFGFQTERRSYWEASEVYDQVSPFRYADRITAPLLLIHGEQDANPGTFPIQSERLFQAIQGTGGTARLVMLPYESHGYLGRESVMDVLAEELDWLERWLGPARCEPR
jgi:dipeptidyl aminopeptidase/acylaminoacyl peptidase